MEDSQSNTHPEVNPYLTDKFFFIKTEYIFHLHSTGNQIDFIIDHSLKNLRAYEFYLSRFDIFHLTLIASIKRNRKVKTTFWNWKHKMSHSVLWFCYSGFTKPISRISNYGCSLAKNIRQLNCLVHNDNFSNLFIPKLLRRDTSRDHSQPNTDLEVNSQYIDTFGK